MQFTAKPVNYLAIADFRFRCIYDAVRVCVRVRVRVCVRVYVK